MMGSGVKLWLVIWFSCLLHRPDDGKWSKTMIGYMIFMSSSQTIWWKWSKTMIGYMIFMSSSQTIWWEVEQNYDWLYDFHVFFTDHMMGSGAKLWLVIWFSCLLHRPYDGSGVKLWLVIWFSCLLHRPDDGKWSKTMIGYMIFMSSSQTRWWEME